MIPWLALIEFTSHCQPIDGDTVLARHLLRGAPALAALPPDTVFGLAPRFGVRRSIPGFELEAFARKHGLGQVTAQSVCMERRSARLSAAAVTAALTAAATEWCRCDVEVALGDFARYPVPAGPLVFPPGGASYPSPQGETHWRGYVDGPARVPIWAKARIETKREVLVAADDLPAQVAIGPQQVRAVTRTLGIRAPSSGLTATEVIGLAPLRSLAAGTVLTRNLLTRLPEVRAGETVLIESESGAVRLQVEGRADSSGRRGERIVVRNLVSGARFAAIVTGPHRATAAGPVTAAPSRGAEPARPSPTPPRGAQNPGRIGTGRQAPVTASDRDVRGVEP